jgi:uncharacterized protein YeeX (DUF496 family)
VYQVTSIEQSSCKTNSHYAYYEGHINLQIYCLQKSLGLRINLRRYTESEKAVSYISAIIHNVREKYRQKLSVATNYTLYSQHEHLNDLQFLRKLRQSDLSHI